MNYASLKVCPRCMANKIDKNSSYCNECSNESSSTEKKNVDSITHDFEKLCNKNYSFNRGRKVFVEVTNPTHGGEGWAFGEALWSPSTDKSQSKTPHHWESLKHVSKDDIIIHLLKCPKEKSYKLYGISKAKCKYSEIDDEPLEPGRWSKSKGYRSYYKIPLKHYSEFTSKPYANDFLCEINGKIDVAKKTFFNKNLKIRQGYLFEVDDDIFYKLAYFLAERGVEFFKNIEILDDDYSDESNFPDPKVRLTTERVIRETKNIKSLKVRFDNKCQICGTKIVLPNGKRYSEGFFLRSVGGYHKGPDQIENIIIVCPNHHVEFSYGAISIDPTNMRVVHIDKSNHYHNSKLFYNRSDLGHDFIRYHNKKIFNSD